MPYLPNDAGATGSTPYREDLLAPYRDDPQYFLPMVIGIDPSVYSRDGGYTGAGASSVLVYRGARRIAGKDPRELPGTLNEVAVPTWTAQQTVAGAGAVIPVIYGRTQTGPIIGAVATLGDDLVLLAVWCVGEIDAVEALTLSDGSAVPEGVTVTHYTGTTSQTTDATLAAALAGWDNPMVLTVAGEDVGVAYSVIRIPPSSDMRLPQFLATIRGRKVYDPRGTLGANLIDQGDFYDSSSWAVGSGWNCTTKKGVASAASASALSQVTGHAFSEGETYRVRFTLSQFSAGALAVYLGTSGQAESLIDTLTDADGDGVYTYDWAVPAGQSGSTLVFYPTGLSVEIDDVSVREVTTAPGTIYSENPALALADFVSTEYIGHGRAVDWDSVASAADACDETLGDAASARREIGLAISRTSLLALWASALRTYAGCFMSDEGGTVKLIPDRPAGYTVSIGDDAILQRGRDPSIRLSLAGRMDTPTVVRVTYTDTTTTPWRDADAYAFAAGVLAGTTEWRQSNVMLPGITRYQQAYREAVERLNSAALCDLSASFSTFDEALLYQEGDLIRLTSSRGLSAKPMRIVGIRATSIGRYDVQAVEYQPGVYDDSIQTAPTFADTSTPSPAAPSTPTGLALDEEVVQLQNGLFATRIRATWDTSSYPHVAYYACRADVGDDTVFSGTTRSPTWVTPPIAEGETYEIGISIVSTIGAQGAEATDTHIALGKYLPPGDVPEITASELGGEVRLLWEPAIDLDIYRYELRWGTVAAAWDDMEFIDKTDSLRYVAREIPDGTWDFAVKAIDSVGNYSDADARVSVVVTLDPSAIAERNKHTSESLTNMASYTLRGDGKTRFVCEIGTAFGALFSSPLGDYTSILASYDAPASSEYLTTANDIGFQLTATWSGSAPNTVIAGSAPTLEWGISTDDISYSWYSLPEKATARYSKVRLTGASGDVFRLARPGPESRAVAVTRRESGTTTTSATLPTTVTLENAYITYKSIVGTVLGETTAHTVVVDNISTGDPTTFDLYAFNSSGTQVAVEVGYTFEGI